MALNTEEILILVAAILGGITFASLITIMLARCLGLCSSICNKYFPDEKKESLKEEINRNLYSSKLPGSVPTRNIPSFKIPGKLTAPTFSVQPAIAERSESPLSMVSQNSDELRPGEERGEPRARSRSASIIQLEEGSSTMELRPELYREDRRTTIGCGNLGKIRFNLQYEDKSRRSLRLILSRLENVQFPRTDIVNIFVNILLLPDREAIHRTKLHFKTNNPLFEDEFLFSSRPMNRDFESKTVLFLVQMLDRSGKQHEYGEARMPLLSREIYSQVQTDVSLNIKPFPPQNEVGDVLVQMSYSNDKEILTMSLKSIKFPSHHTTENMTGLHFRSFIKRNGNRVGKKHSFQTTVQPGGIVFFEVSQHADFKLRKESFLESTIRINIVGKHKVLRKHLTIGKVYIGDMSRDEGGHIHWRTVFSSPELTWTVWHPIYTS